MSDVVNDSIAPFLEPQQTPEVTDEQLLQALAECDRRECSLPDGQELHIAISFVQKCGLMKQYIVFRSGALEAIQ